MFLWTLPTLSFTILQETSCCHSNPLHQYLLGNWTSNKYHSFIMGKNRLCWKLMKYVYCTSIVSIFIQMQIKKKLKSTTVVLSSVLHTTEQMGSVMLYSDQKVVLWPLFSDSSKLPSNYNRWQRQLTFIFNSLQQGD